jgi:hypothetical protein
MYGTLRQGRQCNMRHYTQEQIDEAKQFGWTINPTTGDWSSECIVCNTYAVIKPINSGACQKCADELRKEMQYE